MNQGVGSTHLLDFSLPHLTSSPSCEHSRIFTKYITFPPLSFCLSLAEIHHVSPSPTTTLNLSDPQEGKKTLMHPWRPQAAFLNISRSLCLLGGGKADIGEVRSVGSLYFPQRLSALTHDTHRTLCWVNLAALWNGPRFHRSLGVGGFQLPFISLEPRAWGDKAPL